MVRHQRGCAVALLASPLECTWLHCRGDERRMWLLDRSWPDGGIVHTEELALEGHGLAREGLLHQFQAFTKARPAFFGRHLKMVVLEHIWRTCQAHDQPSVGQWTKSNRENFTQSLQNAGFGESGDLGVAQIEDFTKDGLGVLAHQWRG